MMGGEITKENTEPDTKKPNSASHDERKHADDKTRDRDGSDNK